MTDYKLHAEIFGKQCFNCIFLAADSEPEDFYTEYWCSKEKRILMKRIATLHSRCHECTVRKENS